ncbi:hypothetical protein EVAR_10470_1 [Eumeta japonica]|uniref:Uncharacterized protein n=1 Tax=Eumeta variegata TaxID=151549 RepID=A0A4C1TKR2_EUMVA|nr:hypothetical protein EVAR_10470_1 [Eumeta japonica]
MVEGVMHPRLYKPEHIRLTFSKSGGLRLIQKNQRPSLSYIEKVGALRWSPENKFCGSTTNPHWCVKNSVLHRDLDIPSIAQSMKNASECFFSIAESHSKPLVSAAVSYEAPPPYHFIRRPRNIITDRMDDFSAEVKRLIEINKRNDD